MDRIRVSPVAANSILALLTAAAFLGAALISPETNTKHIDAVAVGFAVVGGAVLFCRRRWPLGVFVVSLAAVTLYMALGYPAVGLAFPLAASVYTAAVRGHAIGAGVVAAVSIVMGVVWRTLFEPERILSVIVNMAQEGGALAAVLLLGEAVRSRRALAEETRERLRMFDAAQEQEAERRVTEERMRIARDIHDVVAHTVTVIGVQANVAAENFGERPAEARAAVTAIQTSTKEAMSELRTAIGVLRDGGDPPLMPAPSAAGIEDLVATAEASGLSVELRVNLPSETTASLGVALYRVTQEALTNVLRHAEATRVAVEIDHDASQVVLRIEDNGRGDSIAGKGNGIHGMKERVGSLGGHLTAATNGSGGFVVRATFPFRPS